MELDSRAIEAKIQHLERERLDLRAKLKNNFWMIGGIILLILMLSFTIPQLAFYLFIAGTIFSIVKFINYYSFVKTFKLRVKNDLVRELLTIIGHDIQFFPQKGIPEKEFEESNLFTQSSDRYHTEDLVLGKYQKTAFYMAEVHAEYKSEHTDSKGNTSRSYYDIFKGIVLVMDFNKRLKGYTVVRPKSTNLFGELFGAIFRFMRSDKVLLENEVFMQKFEVYSTDQVEARYVLTPRLMERLLFILQKKGKYMNLSFLPRGMYMALPFNKNFFEPTMHIALSKEQFQDDIEFVLSMFALIDDLDLNTRIWGSE